MDRIVMGLVGLVIFFTFLGVGLWWASQGPPKDNTLVELNKQAERLLDKAAKASERGKDGLVELYERQHDLILEKIREHKQQR